MRVGRTLTDDELKQAQRIMLELMVEFDEFCNKNHIKYVITGGTLLGAVRHQGFIPWDDDADVAMTRNEYEKLKSKASELSSDTIFFQDHDTDNRYLWGYGKLRRPGTKMVRYGQEFLAGETGVCVDVFPMDDIPKYRFFQKANYLFWTIMRKIIWSRVGKRDSNNPCILNVLYSIISVIPVDFVYFIVGLVMPGTYKEKKRLVHPWARPLWNRDNPNKVKRDFRYGMKKEWFLNRKRYSFEGIELWGSKDADGFLRYCYGDYWRLPPDEMQKPTLEFSEVDL